MNETKLSICLPTYNQADELEKLLNSILPQVTSEVEIVVRDDSTNSDTENLVREFSRRVPIRYFHGVKEGIDKAVIFLVEQARGDFVWWIGDEIVLPGGVGKVLKVINDHPDTSFIWANFFISQTKKLTIDLPESGFFKDRDEILDKAVVGLGFISATIFRRNLAMTGIEGSKKYFGTEFSNLYLILHVLSQPGKYYYIREPVIVNYPATVDELKKATVKNGEIHNRAFEVFGLSFSEILRQFEGPFSSSAVNMAIKRSFGQTWRGMLVSWVGGWDTPKGKRIRMLKYFWKFPEAWVAFVAFLIPLPINRVLFKIYKIFFSQRRFRFGKNRWKGSEETS